MSNKDQNALADALTKLTQKTKVQTYIAVCGSVSPPSDVNMLFARFREDEPDIEALATFLLSQIVNYVIPRSKRLKVLGEAADSDGDYAPIDRLMREAKSKFIEYDSKNPGRASEVGELLAYLVANEWLGAFQIASKMMLKTNANMPVYGVDGLHAKFEGGVMTLFFLESKLSETVSKGVSEYCKSTADFSENRKQYLLENSIINDLGNFDTLSPSDRALALSYLDVYGDNKSQRLERSIGVICYSEPAFKKKLPKNGASPKAHEDNFSEIYESKRQRYKKSLNEAAAKIGMNASSLQVWLFAVPNKNKLRELFGVGVSK